MIFSPKKLKTNLRSPEVIQGQIMVISSKFIRSILHEPQHLCRPFRYLFQNRLTNLSNLHKLCKIGRICMEHGGSGPHVVLPKRGQLKVIRGHIILISIGACERDIPIIRTDVLTWFCL